MCMQGGIKPLLRPLYVPLQDADATPLRACWERDLARRVVQDEDAGVRNAATTALRALWEARAAAPEKEQQCLS